MLKPLAKTEIVALDGYMSNFNLAASKNVHDGIETTPYCVLLIMIRLGFLLISIKNTTSYH